MFTKTKIISEIGLSHLGSIDLAINMVDKSITAGADYVKFQTHIAEYESTYDEKFRLRFSKKYKTRYDYWKETEFTFHEWEKIKKYCDQKKIGFFSSPFSKQAVNLLASLKMNLWKISSGEFFNDELIKEICKFPGEIILSTGMATMPEIRKRINFFKLKKKKFTILQCTSEYPVKLKDVGFNVVDEIKKKFKCNVGLSDHSGSIYPSLLAISKNLRYLEIHCCNSKSDFGPDSSSSLTFDEIRFICDCRDNFYILNTSKPQKNLTKKLKKMRKLFTKSLALKNDFNKGEIIKESDLILKKPGTGISPNLKKKIIGKKIRKFYSSKYLLKKSDYIN